MTKDRIGPGANLRDANLRRANLYCADLRGADLRGADLRFANLRDANLRFASLWGATLRGADLRGANLYCADLRCAYLRGANLRDAIMPNGRRATDLVIRLARAGACVDAIVWASNLDPQCSWRTAWHAAHPDWRDYFDSYHDAFDELSQPLGTDE